MSNHKEDHHIASYNIRKADWKLYRCCSTWRSLPSVDDLSNEDLLEDLYSRFESANNFSIPKYTVKNYYPKPWWTPELTNSKKMREHAYRKYRRNRSPRNITTWKRLRAQHILVVLESKKQTWRTFTSEMNKNTPLALVFEKIREMRGKT